MPAAGVELHEANAALDQPASDQTFAAEVSRQRMVEAVERASAGVLAVDVDDLAGARLHAVGQLVCLDACGQLRIAGPGCLVLQIQTTEQV